jgi:hypothetical protein
MRGPNFYADLKRAHGDPSSDPIEPANLTEDQQRRLAALEDTRSELQPPQHDHDRQDDRRRDPRAEPNASQRADNEKMVADNAAWQHQKQREERGQEVSDLAAEHRDKLIEQAKVMGELHTRFEAHGQNPLDEVEKKVLERAGGRDGSDRFFHDALAQQRDGGDPYGTLKRTAMSEHAAFEESQAQWDARIKNAESVDQRHSLEQRKDIEASDYLASTSHRIADQAEMIAGPYDHDAVAFRERAAAFHNEGKSIQDNFRSRGARDDLAERPEQGEDRSSPEPQATQQDRVHVSQPEAAPSRASSREASEWDEAAHEITDDKRERLDRLETASSTGGGYDGPTRPHPGGGREM